MTDLLGGTSNDNHYIALLSSGIQSNRRGRKRFQNQLAKIVGLAAVLTTLGVLLVLSYDYYGSEDKIIHQIVPSVNKGLIEKYNESFEQFIRRYNKKYTSFAEKTLRFETFVKNMIFIELHNEENSSYKLAINSFADLTFEEFKNQYITGYRSNKEFFISSSVNESTNETSELAEEIDWRKKNCVTPVKNQGQCGSCWSFSTTGAVEGAYCAKHGKLFDLSEQQLVDCSDQNGCNGGVMEKAFKWLSKTPGLCTEESYSYKAIKGHCQSCTPVVKVSGFHFVPFRNSTALVSALTNRPVSVAVDAANKDFQFYRSGVFTGKCGTELNHGMLVVGYGTDLNSTKDYWIVKNSWSADWGLEGYILLDRSTSSRSGKCGILLDASYPVIV